MDYQEMLEFAFKIKDKLKDDLFGEIVFFLSEEADCIVFDISYMGISYKTVAGHIKNKMLNGISSDDIARGIEDDYRKYIIKKFFKSRERKNIICHF